MNKGQLLVCGRDAAPDSQCHSSQCNGLLEAKDNDKVLPKLAIFTFAVPAKTFRMSYSSQKEIIGDKLCRHKWFAGGKILQTLEKGVLYPIIHFMDLATSEPDPEAILLLERQALGRDYYLQQALYEELDSISLPVIFQPLPCLPPSSPTSGAESSRAYILLGFKTLDQTYNNTFEEHWKDLTGARSIYLNLSTQLGLSKVSFFRRLRPKEFNSFVYILFVVCTNVTAHNNFLLLDFVHRLRLRMLGYLTVYSNFSRSPAQRTQRHINRVISQPKDPTDALPN